MGTTRLHAKSICITTRFIYSAFAHTLELVILRYTIYKCHQRGSDLHVGLTAVDRPLLAAYSYSYCTVCSRKTSGEIRSALLFGLYSSLKQLNALYYVILPSDTLTVDLIIQSLYLFLFHFYFLP